MIFVTVGNHKQPFDRLLSEAERLACLGDIRSVFVQSGSSDLVFECCEYQKFLSMSDYQTKIEHASVVVTHGGAGTIALCLEAKTPVVVVPRKAKYGEHTNDHQKDLAQALAAEGRIVLLEDTKYLKNAIEDALGFRPNGLSNEKDKGEIVLRAIVNKLSRLSPTRVTWSKILSKCIEPFDKYLDRMVGHFSKPGPNP